MDMNDKHKFGLEKRNDDPLDYHPANMSLGWRFSGANLENAPINLVPTGNPMALGSSSSSSAPTVDSFNQTVWAHPSNSQNLGYCDIGAQNDASSSTGLGIRKANPAFLGSSITRPLDMGWNPVSSMLKGGVFLPNAPGMFPQSSQFSADSTFIERAARFSSFGSGNFSDMMNAFGIPELTSLLPRGVGMMQGPREFFAGSGLRSVPGGQSQKNEMNTAEVSKDASLSVEHGVTDGIAVKNETKGESLVKSQEVAKQGSGGSGNDSNEAEFSGGGGGQDKPSALDGTGWEPSAKGLSANKRKRSGLDTEHDQTKGSQLSGEPAKDNTENQQKGDQTPTSTTNKTPGKQGKQGTQTSDQPKEEYIHVRARRGQATNSHSLAERVRREKISERMKFLQDLVPGCSKVTGKAVMLDEIINYVQSLQRQVEFLSMKLATVNPRLDLNIEDLLAKDMLQSRAGPLSTLGYSHDMSMAYTPLPGMGSQSDILQRTINSQLTPMTGGFKEPTQTTNVWEDELHNVVQMSYGTSAPSDSQNVNASTPSHMKVEL